MSDDFDLGKPAIEFASQNPKKIDDESMLASDALRLIEEHKIQMLVVVDEQNRPVGVLHIHDLVEAGIK
jgi:arabinose-5-phosphate isomerase